MWVTRLSRDAEGKAARHERKDRLKRLLLSIAIGLLGNGTTLAGQDETGCHSRSTSHDCATAKNRQPRVSENHDVKGAPTALTLGEFFDLTCQLNEEFDDIVGRQPDTIPGAETAKVTVHAYLLAVRWEKDDNDLHVQIERKPKWTRDQLVVEIPAGPDFDGPRTIAFNAVIDDAEKYVRNTIHDGHIMRHRLPVQVTEFFSFDGSHGNTTDGCDRNGGRGTQLTFKDSPARGLWEIPPVIDIELVE
jgi:hypothetical protein